MEKANITGIENFGKIHRYLIKKQKDIHGLFCNLFSEFKLNRDAIDEIDMIFDDLDNEYLYICEKGFEFHFFITKDFVNLVIKTDIAQRELNDIMFKYFKFP